MLESPGVHLRGHEVGCVRFSLEPQTQIFCWGLLMTVEIAKGPCLGDSLGTGLGSGELTQGKL